MPRTTVRTDSTSAQCSHGRLNWGQVQVRYSMLNETWLTFQWCDELWKCRPYPIPTIRQENQDPSHRQLAVRLLFFRQTFKEHRQPFLVVEVLSVFLQRTLIKNRTCTSNPIHDLVWNSDFTKPPLKWPHGCVISLCYIAYIQVLVTHSPSGLFNKHGLTLVPKWKLHDQ